MVGGRGNKEAINAGKSMEMVAKRLVENRTCHKLSGSLHRMDRKGQKMAIHMASRKIKRRAAGVD